MNEIINQLQRSIEDTENDNTPWIAGVLDAFGDNLTSILSAPGRCIGNLVKRFASLFKND